MIILKNKDQIELMAQGGQKLAEILHELLGLAKPGLKVSKLNQQAEKLIYLAGGKPSFKGYLPDHGHQIGYPYALCVSINEEIVHGLPSEEKIINEGDLVSLDLGLLWKGFHTDMAMTVGIGKISLIEQSLLKVTRAALGEAIKKIKPGVALNKIGQTIENLAQGAGFRVVQDLVGHGIGQDLQEDPLIPNYYHQNHLVLKNGMVLAIEPMLTIGRPAVRLKKDGWTVVTVDGSKSAHFEQTVTVTSSGYQILTPFA